MFFNGKQTQSKQLYILVSALFFSSIVSADFNQYLPNQKDLPTLDQYKASGDASHLSGSKVKPMDSMKDSAPSGHLPGEKNINPSFLKANEVKGIQSMGTQKSTEYLEYHSKDLLREANDKGKSSYAFSFIKDTFDYMDDFDSYNTVFKEPSGTTQGGFLMVHSAHYISRKYVDLFYAVNGGLGLSYGQGIFVTGEIAESTFRLWKIPVDIGLGIGIPLGPWFTIVGAAGPSLLGLIQNRSDQARGNEKKERRQFSYGYYTEAKIKWNLSPIFQETSMNMLQEQNVSNFYLDVFVRQQQYENFKQEDIVVSGQSIGLGFSFDFL